MKTIFIIFVVALFGIMISCNKDIETNDSISAETQQNKTEESTTNNDETSRTEFSHFAGNACLEDNLVDSFLFYLNEYNNYLFSEDGLFRTLYMRDSSAFFGLIDSLIELNSPVTFEGYVKCHSKLLDIPQDVVSNYLIFSDKISPRLLQETETNHPIASRYIDLVIDDFTDIITVRCFDLNLNNVEEGDFISVFGYIKEYNDVKRVYAKKVFKQREQDIFYWKIRIFKEKGIKLDKEKAKLMKKEKENVEENEGSSEIKVDEIEIETIEIEDTQDLKQEILNIIKSQPNKEISLDDLYKIAEEKLKLERSEVDKLLEEVADEIFEPRPGYIKLIEI